MSDRSEPSVADRVRRSTPRLRLRESEALRAGIRHRFGDARQVSPSGWTSVNASAGRARHASVFGRQVFVGEPVAGSSFRSRCAGFEAAEIGGLAGGDDRHGEMLEHVAASSNGHRRSGSCPPRGTAGIEGHAGSKASAPPHWLDAARPAFRSPGCARLAAIAAAVTRLPIACAAWRARAAFNGS